MPHEPPQAAPAEERNAYATAAGRALFGFEEGRPPTSRVADVRAITDGWVRGGE